MIEIFLTLIDKVTQLLKEKQSNKEKVFNDIIEPIFNDMCIVVQDYLKLHVAASLAIEKLLRQDYFSEENSDLKDEIIKIAGHSEEFIHLRIKVQEMVKQLKVKSKDEDIKIFANSILHLFYGDEIDPYYDIFGTPATKVIELLHSFESGILSEQEINFMINAMRIDLKTAWFSITKNYAKLRIKYLSQYK